MSPAWSEAIAAFLEAQAAAGHPRTTRTTRRHHLAHLAKHAPPDPWQLTGDQLAAYAASYEWATETRRGKRNTFVAFWAWAIATGRTDHDPTEALARIKPASPSPRPVPDHVYAAALARADQDEALWIDLAAEHGLRRAEIARVHSSDLVQTLLGIDLLVHGKGGKLRTVPLTQAMARALLERIERNGPGWLWTGERDGHVSPEWIGKRLAALLGGGWTTHKLRHRAATRFWQVSGGDPYAVADLMGWANLNMVRTYVAQPSDRLRGIVERASRSGVPLTVNR